MRKTCFFVVLFLLLIACTTALAWSCTNCGASNSYNFCNVCGTPKPGSNTSTFCGMCGKSITSADVYCPHCGHNNQGGGSQVSSKPWPTVTLPYVQVYFHPSGDSRVIAYCGPGDYPEDGGYKTMKMRTTYALFTDGNYTLIDMDYMTVGHRRVYFRKSAYPKNKYNIPAFNYTAHPAVTTSSVTPMYGPGSDYDTFPEAQISSGTYLDVYFEENGYVFAEFQCKKGRVRAWINVNHVRAN